MNTQTTSEPNRPLNKLLRSRLVSRLSFPHGVDAYLQAVNPLWSATEVRAELVDIRSQTSDTVTVRLKPNSNWQGFAPGQFVQLTVEIDGVLHTRCYSPASSAHQGKLIELSCKIGPSSKVSRYLRDEARVGQIVTLSQAAGSFALPAERPERIVLISGGSGITPVMSMLRSLCEEGHTGPISFLHYCNSPRNQLYARELEDIASRHANVQLLRAYAEAGHAGELQGLFSAAQLSQAVPGYAQAQTFLCGPPGMMQAVQQAYDEAGLSEQLHLEHFSAPAISLPESDSAEGEVRFARSERLIANSGESLLEQAEAAGLKPQAGCRMGICYSCTCRKSAGQVRDLRTGQISEAGEADIQICVSVPVGTVVLDI